MSGLASSILRYMVARCADVGEGRIAVEPISRPPMTYATIERAQLERDAESSCISDAQIVGVLVLFDPTSAEDMQKLDCFTNEAKREAALLTQPGGSA